MFNIFRRSEYEKRAHSGFDALLFLHATAANIALSPESAMRCIPVYAGVRVIAETIGQLPCHLYRRLADGSKERASAHSLYRLIHDRPNPWTSAPEFFMAMQMDVLAHGHAFAMANRIDGEIRELIRLEPRSVRVEVDDVTLEPRYRVTLRNGGGQRFYAWQDILHISALSGLSPLVQAREAIALCLAMEKHAGNLFGSGARPSGLLKVKGKLSSETAQRLRESWQQSHGGSEQSGKTAVLEDDIEFQPLTFSSVDLQFQELRAFQVVEIARALRVPPVLIMDYGRATWSNSEEMGRQFLTFSILPWLKVWQGSLSRLLSEEEQKTFYPEFMVDDLTRADLAARFGAYAQAITNGILNPNEVRAMENRSPYSGGDQFRLPMNTEDASGAGDAD